MSKVINDRIIELLHKRLTKEALTEEEQKELQQWIELSPENELLSHELNDEQSFSEALEKFSTIDTEASLQQVRQRIFVDKEAEELPTIRTNQMPWRRYAAAAIILILLMAGGVYYFQQQGPDQTVTAKKDDPIYSIPPGGDKTRLTLSNGSKIIDLDVSQNGKLVMEESAVIHGEKLLYDIANDANNTAGTVMLNTLANPRGLKQEVVLPDGSIVWLNAVSAIRFPHKFSGNERRIELMGEAEFEITKDASKPFIVQVVSAAGEPKGTDIRVLGTHFTITAYNDEQAITTTLMEGSVEVLHNNRANILKPGEQAVVSGNSVTINDNVDVQPYKDRKKGVYTFTKTPLKTIMDQVKRMYNVEVEYDKNENSLPREINYTLSQNVKLKDLILFLNKLVQSDDFECNLSRDQKTIMVTGKAK